MSDESERHASWPELFFDLIAVAGVSVVAHQLESEQSWQHVAVLALAFAAFWIVWASVTTYGNLLADGASIAVLFTSMAVLGVMAASVPEIYGEHARAFAIAYVVGRLIIARPWSRTSVVVDMPIVQASLGVIPWIVSIWIEGDARYVWWAVGIAIDLWVLATASGERRVAQTQERLNRVLEMRSRHPERAQGRENGPRSNRATPTTVTALRGDSAHLGERMGLFVLIILGEGIVQLTVAAEASEHWSRSLLWAAVGAFSLVCALFVVAVLRGTAGLALLPEGLVPARVLWIGHLFVAMALVVVVAALGELLEDPAEPASGHTATMLALGIGVYGVVSGLALLSRKGARRWIPALAVGAPLLVAGVVVLLAHESLRASALGWLLAGAVVVAGALGGRLLASKGAPPAGA